MNKKIFLFLILFFVFASPAWAQEKFETPVLQTTEKWEYKTDNGQTFMVDITGVEDKFYLINSTEHHMDILRVVVAWLDFDANSWEQAVPVKVTQDLQMYEATIYPDRVHLYKFDNTFNPLGYDPDTGVWYGLGGPAWVAYREKYAVSKIQLNNSADATERSQQLTNAFKSFFDLIVTDTPSLHYGLTFSGHGSGTGGLFQNNITPGDAKDLLYYANDLIGTKMDFLDLGGPCSEGNFTVIENFYPHFNFIIASDLPIGGYTMDNWTYEKYVEVKFEENFYRVFIPEFTVIESLMQLLDLRRKEYEYSKGNMITNSIKQSLSIFETEYFEDLII